MRIIAFTMVFPLISGALGSQPVEPDEIDSKVAKTIITRRADKIDDSWLTPDLRTIVIGRLLKRAEDASQDRMVRESYEDALIKLGHVETIRARAEKMKEPRFGSAGLDWAPEVAIPYIMPLVLEGSTEEPYMEPGSDVILTPVRDVAFLTVLLIVVRRDGFPDETRAWAGSLKDKLHGPAKEQRARLLVQWWEKNQTAIVEGRYSDAGWLPRYKGRPSTLSDEELNERKQDAEEARAGRRVAQVGSPDEVQSVSPRFGTGARFWITLAATGLLVVGFLHWKRSLTP
jgi:hypothetical protein